MRNCKLLLFIISDHIVHDVVEKDRVLGKLCFYVQPICIVEDKVLHKRVLEEKRSDDLNQCTGFLILINHKESTLVYNRFICIHYDIILFLFFCINFCDLLQIVTCIIIFFNSEKMLRFRFSRMIIIRTT